MTVTALSEELEISRNAVHNNIKILDETGWVKLIKVWEPKLGVNVEKFYVRRMKTKWGSCTPQKRTIRLNTELAKKPKPCLEYLVVHEMVHLLEPTHNERFVGYMDLHLPNWRHTRNTLNDLPVRHENWRY